MKSIPSSAKQNTIDKVNLILQRNRNQNNSIEREREREKERGKEISRGRCNFATAEINPLTWRGGHGLSSGRKRFT